MTRDSIFIDTPLCATGIKQGADLHKFITKDYDIEKDRSKAGIYLVSRDAAKSSIVVCSNLRRAMSTCLIALQDRLRVTNEKVYMLSSLQVRYLHDCITSIYIPVMIPIPLYTYL